MEAKTGKRSACTSVTALMCNVTIDGKKYFFSKLAKE
jgi:hypothetical protein